MAKRISETQRLITFGLSATKEGLNMAIETLTAIRDKNFPAEKKNRKPRKVKPVELKLPGADLILPTRGRKSKSIADDEPKAVARKCVNCDWTGEMIAPEPCPDCGDKTEVA